MRLARWLLIFVLSAGSARTVDAAEITSLDLDDGDVAIFISGEIEPADSEKFRREAAKHKNAAVVLESEGGSTVAAIEIGEAIRLRGFSTLVVNGSTCASACGLIWLAGTPRVITHSARVGFHATYTRSSGQLEESGLGNALVGRYFALLNLPVKAVIFTTKAAPNQMNWLNRHNFQSAGIELQIVDDFDLSEDEKNTPPVITTTPPPVFTPRKIETTSTILWKNVSGWRVMNDPSINNSCFITTSFLDGTVFRIGVDRQINGQNYILLGNENWQSLKEGDQHKLTVKFDNGAVWDTPTKVIKIGNGRFLRSQFNTTDVWVDFATSKNMTIETTERIVTKLSLEDSKLAVDSLIECQDYYDRVIESRDPFAK